MKRVVKNIVVFYIITLSFFSHAEPEPTIVENSSESPSLIRKVKTYFDKIALCQIPELITARQNIPPNNINTLQNAVYDIYNDGNLKGIVILGETEALAYLGKALMLTLFALHGMDDLTCVAASAKTDAHTGRVSKALLVTGMIPSDEDYHVTIYEGNHLTRDEEGFDADVKRIGGIPDFISETDQNTTAIVALSAGDLEQKTQMEGEGVFCLEIKPEYYGAYNSWSYYEVIHQLAIQFDGLLRRLKDQGWGRIY